MFGGLVIPFPIRPPLEHTIWASRSSPPSLLNQNVQLAHEEVIYLKESGSQVVAQKGEISDTLSRDASDVVASVEILTLVGAIPQFRQWLVEKKGIPRNEHDLRGIQFFMEVGLNSLAYAVRLDSTLEMSESHALSRAEFRGIDIDEVPNDCEKTILLKRIRLIARHIRKCKTWTDLEVSIDELNQLTSVIRKGIQKSIAPGYCLSRQDAVNLATKKHLLLYFQNTEKGIPVICLLSGFQESRKTGWLLADVFRTYVLCLEYVWAEFPFSRLTHSRTRNIENKIGEFKPVVIDHLEREESFFSSLPGARREPPKHDRTSKEEQGLVSWMALDLWSKKLYESELEPMERKLGNMFWKEPIIRLEGINKKDLRALFTVHDIPRPSYIEGTTWDARTRLLDYHFLWYEMEVLEKGDVRIFNGVPAFLSVVMGAYRLRQSFGNEDPIVVRVFKHPVTKFEKGYEYSYAMLMEVYGMLSDFSGWLVFSDCAGEYSGHPEPECQMARKWLERMEREGQINLEEITIALNHFKRYLQENGRVLVETDRGLTIMDSRRVIENLREMISISRGKLFEYIVYKWLSSEAKYSELKGPGDFRGEQVDCLGINDSVVDVYECKVDIHKRIEEVIGQVLAKQEAVRKEFPGRKVVPYLVVYLEVETARSLELMRFGIRVIDNFRKKIRSGGINKSDKEQIVRILDYQAARIRE